MKVGGEMFPPIPISLSIKKMKLADRPDAIKDYLRQIDKEYCKAEQIVETGHYRNSYVQKASQQIINKILVIADKHNIKLPKVWEDMK